MALQVLILLFLLLGFNIAKNADKTPDHYISIFLEDTKTIDLHMLNEFTVTHHISRALVVYI